jgi:hypothetical protein
VILASNEGVFMGALVDKLREKKDKKKEKEVDNMKISKILAFLLGAVLGAIVQVGVITLLYYLISLCLPITFNFKYAVGFYLVLILIYTVINLFKRSF